MCREMSVLVAILEIKLFKLHGTVWSNHQKQKQTNKKERKKDHVLP